jgi:hypothetical protein
MSSCPPSGGSTSQGGTLTCNGDGNGEIGRPLFQEEFYFWQHLADAQLIDGNYSGINDIGCCYGHIIGVNSPAARLPGAGFGLAYAGVPSPWPFFSTTYNYGHVFFIGAPIQGWFPENSIITALEAQSFDNKYDDGLPGTGKIQTWTHGYGNDTSNTDTTGSISQYCATTTNASTAVYNTSSSNPNSSGIMCSLILVTGF